MSKSQRLIDDYFIRQTLELAKKGLSWTHPNPMVGSLVVKNGKIIGQGYHYQAGKDHAEIAALKSAKENVKGATLYVNLEPCNHYGRTPPCVTTIVKSGISRVVCSTVDPNPQVKGHGIKILQNAGIKVEIGLLETEAKNLNEAFFTYHEKKRPFIALKFAVSLDGKIATKTHDSKWITDKIARDYARILRGEYQAILVGIKTIIRDNPHLGVRSKEKKDPLRIILDSRLRIPLNSLVLRDKNLLIATTVRANTQKKKILEAKGVRIIEFENDNIPPRQLLDKLYKLGIISLLIEGGGKTLGSFIDERLVDKVYAFYAPIIIGGQEAISAVRGRGVEKITEAIKLENVSFKKLGGDFLITGYAS